MAEAEVLEPSLEAAWENYPPTTWGPTWRTNEDGTWLLPKLTLGWECLKWCAEHLVNEDGEPWMFTGEQARFVLWWYEITEDGRRAYERGVLQRLKGWGKDPLAAALCCFEFIGPCKFDHFDPNVRGGVVGKENPQGWVVVVGVAKEQTKNTMLLIPSLLSRDTRTKYNIEVQKELIQIKGYPNRRIEAVSSSDRAMEGNRPTFGVAGEIHHWVPTRGGGKLWRTLRNNLAKTEGTLLAVTNAYQPGEDSVGERLREAERQVLEGRAGFAGVLYDSLEANSQAPLTADWAPYILEQVRGDAYWFPIKSAVLALQGGESTPAELRRFWYNQITNADDALYSEGEWDKAAAYDAPPLKKGEEIVLGFDGGKTDDATALVAIRVSDKVAFPIKVWQKPEADGRSGSGDKWHVSIEDVDSWVRACMRDYTVRVFCADVHPWEDHIRRWGEDFRDQLPIKASAEWRVGYDMRGNLKETTHSHEALMASIRAGSIKHNGDALLKRHALNARVRNNNYGVSFAKEEQESPNKVDAYAALLLAFIALKKYTESGRTAPKKNPLAGRVFMN